MVVVRFSRSQAGEILELCCSGHAAFDDGQGLDLVCAAVSALTGALGLGLTDVLSHCACIDCEDGLFAMRLKPDLTSVQSSGAQVLLETVARAFHQMAEHYPGFLVVESFSASGAFESGELLSGGKPSL